MIGIICAMDVELKQIRELACECENIKVASFEFIKGKIYGKEVVMCVCGVGKVFAALCAHTMIMTFSPEIIINVGVAGNLSDKLKIGDIAIADSLVQHDMDTSALGDPVGLISGINVVNFDCSKTAVERICEICTDMGINHHVGTIATGDRFVASQAEKDRIVSLFNGIACDMEGGAIAQACYINNVPFSAIRALSDDADSGSPSDFGEFCRKSAENSAEVVRRFIEKY